VFDLFDFTPVDDDPFKKGGTPSPVVSEFQKGQPDPNADKLAAASAIPTDQTVQPDTMVGKAGANIVKMLARTFAGSDAEDWAEYAGNPLHPMPARIGSAVGEEARRFGTGVVNDVNTLMGPMYGEGHVPMFGDLSSEGRQSSYAGAGINLASMMGGPGGETGVGAGWNPGASKYLQSLLKSKPTLKPETLSAVQTLIDKGPEFGQRFFETAPENTPGKGFAALATTKHLMEEAAKPQPPSIVPPAAQAAEAASVAGAPSVAPKPVKAPKMPKAVKSAPVTPEQALGFGQPATQADLNQLFAQKVPALQVPTMKPYDPNVPYPASLAHETAPGTSGAVQPFNPGGLPMDQKSVMQRMQEQNYAPIDKNWLFWRGVKQHGPFSWDSEAMGYRDPSTKANEPGLFLAPNMAQGKSGKPIANMYGPNVNPHVVRADNPAVVDWKKEAGGTMYSSSSMQKVIKKYWAKGHDAVLLKGINDLGGHQDQLVVRHANQVRHPHAAFDPAQKGSRNLLAAGGLGGPVVVPDEEGGDDERTQ
jgi:hypothetical protein